MEKPAARRKLVGVVSSDKMDKTVIVKTEATKVHPKYLKRYKVFKKYAAHSPNNEYKTGERVEIEESRPKSRSKHWVVIRKVT